MNRSEDFREKMTWKGLEGNLVFADRVVAVSTIGLWVET